MAVIGVVPSIEVTIEIDGTTATEYDDPRGDEWQIPDLDVAENDVDTPPAYVVKYIESKPDASFRFRINKTPSLLLHGAHHMAYQVHADKISMALSHDRDLTFPRTINSYNTFDPVERRTVVRSFFFRDVVPTDAEGLTESEAVQQLNNAASYGVLVVKFFRMTNSPRTVRPENPDTCIQDGKLYTKVLKGRQIDCLVG
ncbi:hypothetical protein HK405_008996, partial [Cladochytrium tenue]